MFKKRLLMSIAVCFTGAMTLFVACNKSSPLAPAGFESASGSVTHHIYGCKILPKDQYNKIPLSGVSINRLMTASAVFTLDCPPVGDQGQQGSCTAWGTTYAARSISWHNLMGGTWSTSTNIFSPAYVYNQTKSSSDCNSGAYTTDPLNLLVSQGVCRWSLMPYTDTDCSTQPNSSQKSDASNYKIASYLRVGLTTDSIKSMLLSNKAVIVGGDVNSAFENLASGAVLTSFSGSSLGGHCYCVVGYDDNKQAFKFLNSWGTTWATSGYGYISYNYIKSWWQEAYVINENSAPSLPGQASNPNPANSATGVSTSPTLSWTSGTGATSHDVYFGTSNPPSFKVNQTGTSYSAGTLTANTKYYWRIDEKNSTGTTTGIVWSFTTGSGGSTPLFENFESGTKTAYAAGSVTLSTGSWYMDDALIGTLSTDRKNGNQSVRVRNTGKVTMQFDKPDGAGTVSVLHAIFSADGSSTWELWMSTNSGSTWSKVGNTVTTSSTTLTKASFTVNQTGKVRFEIRKISGGTNRINLDDFSIN